MWSDVAVTFAESSHKAGQCQYKRFYTRNLIYVYFGLRNYPFVYKEEDWLTQTGDYAVWISN